MRNRAVVVVLAATVVAGGIWQWPRVQRAIAVSKLRAEFQQQCPRPRWWDRVQVPKVRTYSELLAYWQRKDRSPEQFFKAAYQAIVDYPLDTDLVVLAVNLMPSGNPTYFQLDALGEFALNRYFWYQTPLANYLGKPGDTVAGIVEDLARIYNGRQQYDHTITLIDRLLAERERDINDQMLELLSMQLADALHKSGRVEEARAVLRRAIDTYHGDWEARLTTQLASYETQ